MAENQQPENTAYHHSAAPASEEPPTRSLYVPLSSMGVFIGRDWENIMAMRGWPGITCVKVSAAIESSPLCLITVRGESHEAVDGLAEYIAAQAPKFAKYYAKVQGFGTGRG